MYFPLPRLETMRVDEARQRGSGGSKGGARDVRPPSGPKFLYFHAVFRKNWPNNRFVAPPPFGLAPPPLGNPGSATARDPP